MTEQKARYGLLTAIAMVIGVVIGSGVFFKADDVLTITNGNVIIALLAWIVGAFAMIFGSLVFAEYASRVEKANGIIDYFEISYGKKSAYLAGWFSGVLYYSPLSAILAYVSALYTVVVLGAPNPDNSLLTWLIAIAYLIGGYLLNYYAPILSGRFQVGTTIIKLIPLFFIGLLGIVVGFQSNVSITNFKTAATTLSASGGTFSMAVVATAFAFEGWIVAVTLNNEIQDSKKNLPRALILGALIVFLIYVAYFLGIAGMLPTEQIIAEGNQSVSTVATMLFGKWFSVILTVFVVISCLGTLNGLIMACIRIPYSMAIRNQGPLPQLLCRINAHNNMPSYSTIFAALLSFVYLLIWYLSLNNAFGRYIALDEIPIVMMYGLYLLLYFWYMAKFKDLKFIKRFVIPIMATFGTGIILYGGISNPSIGFNMVISILILLIGLLFYRKDYR